MTPVIVLQVVDAETLESLGFIKLTGDTVTTDGPVAEGVWRQFRGRFGTDPETFDRLRGGWSNGYVTIPALPSPA